MLDKLFILLILLVIIMRSKKKPKVVSGILSGVSPVSVNILIVLGLFVLSLLFAPLFSTSEALGGKVVVLPIKGVISEADNSLLSTTSYVSASDVVSRLKSLNKDDSVRAVILEINSPGGSPVGSERIVSAVKKMNKTVVAVIEDIGTSGAYWVASAADRVFASRLSIVGSVGVISSYLEFSGLLQRYNITYQRLVAGKYKDMGSPFKPLTPDERSILEGVLEDMHQVFLSDVVSNRNLSEDVVSIVREGRFFDGEAALKIGLVDETGDIDSAFSYLKDRFNTSLSLVRVEKKTSLLDLLSRMVSYGAFYFGKGFGSVFFENAYFSPRT